MLRVPTHFKRIDSYKNVMPIGAGPGIRFTTIGRADIIIYPAETTQVHRKTYTGFTTEEVPSLTMSDCDKAHRRLPRSGTSGSRLWRADVSGRPWGYLVASQPSIKPDNYFHRMEKSHQRKLWALQNDVKPMAICRRSQRSCRISWVLIWWSCFVAKMRRLLGNRHRWHSQKDVEMSKQNIRVMRVSVYYPKFFSF